MKWTIRPLCLLLLVLLGLLTLPSSRCLADNSVADTAPDAIENDDIVQLNPGYVEDDCDDSHEEDDEQEEESDDEGVGVEKSTKGALSQALKQSKQTMKFFKKHRSNITLALIMFAFRREIKMAIHHLVTRQIVDPSTGERSFQLRNVNPTSVLKLIIFIEFMRRSQLNGDHEEEGSSASALLMFNRTNPLLKLVLLRLLGKSPLHNPAFVPPIQQHYTFERFNERYIKDAMALQKAINSRHSDLKWPSESSFKSASGASQEKVKLPVQESDETVIVMDLTKVDTSVSIMDTLRDQVSFLLSQYRCAAMHVAVSGDDNKLPKDESADHEKLLGPAEMEVVVILESPGGSAADFGLAAQQLLRLRNEPSVKLTICVDKVAASGGYMLACTASPGRLFAAPFSIIGSIGVIGQTVNINKVLEKYGVQPLIFRGGKDKAPLGLIGEVTRENKEKVQEMVDDTHRSFKRHVAESRPVLADRIDEVSTGNVWVGYDALDLGLIDKITTSDEYLSEKVKEGARVLKLVRYYRRTIFGGRQPPPPYASIQSQSPLIHNLAQRIQNCMYNVAGALGFQVDRAVGENQNDARMENLEGFPSLRFPPSSVSAGSTTKPIL